MTDPSLPLEPSAREDFWRGRRVLVTGHTGFKGAWLCLWLQQLGAEVAGYALAPPSQPNLFELARVADGMRSTLADVRDADRVAAAFAAHQPEIVLHLAAQALVRPSYDDPVETYSTNVMGTVHVLEAARRTSSVRALVNVTSDKCYENREWLWPYRENEPMGGHDPYSSSKGCAELVTSAYRRSFFSVDGAAQLASARAGNVIGGGDWGVDRLIPDLVRAIAERQPLHIRSPHAVRPWQHVLEALAGYLLLAQRLVDCGGEPGAGSSYAEGWNFGPDANEARTVGWIVERLIERWRQATGEDVEWTRDGGVPQGDQPHEAHLLRLDASKAHQRLGWRPRLDLAAALGWIVDWTHAYRQQQDMRRVTEDQIRAYRDLS